MNISGIGSFGWTATTTTRNTVQQNLPGDASPMTDSTTQAFLNYMKETPGQQMQDAWLAEHGISKQQFAAMSATQKQKIIDEMKADIEAKAKQKTEAQAYSSVDVMA